ncbi:hypothetical protein BGW80DRAFT_1164495 [Lactifluus volemus]|nr:hypothetical protein BGW80DRAFT_1164495 [Lactifluus volemus]
MRFSNPALYEVMRIIPLTLRITHYTRAPASWPGRPTIHVAGEWHSTTLAPNELTCLRGTVEMTASGDIRWTLLSFREDGEGKWASEGVQLGGRGSAMGVIGMWTGAEHEPDDPLGTHTLVATISCFPLFSFFVFFLNNWCFFF